MGAILSLVLGFLKGPALAFLTKNKKLLAIGIGSLVLAGSLWFNVHLYRANAAKDAQCTVLRQQDSAAVNKVSNDIETKNLRDQVAQLTKIAADQAIARAKAAARLVATEQTLTAYRKELDDARKTDPSLDLPLDPGTVGRLRHAEADYLSRRP